MADDATPIRGPRGDPEVAARVTAFAERLGVKPRSPNKIAMSFSGSHGEHYDFFDMMSATLTKVDEAFARLEGARARLEQTMEKA